LPKSHVINLADDEEQSKAICSDIGTIPLLLRLNFLWHRMLLSKKAYRRKEEGRGLRPSRVGKRQNNKKSTNSRQLPMRTDKP
jgi:hypothetical protein